MAPELDQWLTHPNRKKLDEVRPSLCYNGWEVDFRDAEDAHQERGYSSDFPKALRKMKVKQKLHDGDRSHPRLVSLDTIIQQGISFPGWEADVQQLEKLHAETPYQARNDFAFRNKLKALEFSQKTFEQTGKMKDDSSSDGEESFTDSTATPQPVDPPTAEEEAEKKSKKTHAFGTCTICGDGANSHAFNPCGHLCACQECASKVMRRGGRCPVCRCQSLGTLQIFVI